MHLGEVASRLTSTTGVMPAELSQEGISTATGIPRKHIPRNLKAMLDKGLLTESQANVKGAAQRRKVYLLTREGEELSRAIRQEALGSSIHLIIRDDGDGKEVKDDGDKEEEKGYGDKKKEKKERGEKDRELPLGEAMKLLIHRHPEVGKRGLLYLIRQIEELEGRDELAEARVLTGLEDAPKAVKYVQTAPVVRQFFGREREQKAIRELLEQRKMVVVYGITGIGKSALTSHFVDSHPGSVFWYTFHEWDSLHNLLSPFARFLEALGRGKAGLKEGDRGVNESLSLLKEGLDRSEALIVLDDSQKATRELKAFLEGLVFGLEELTDVRFLVLSRQVPEFYSRREVALKKTVGEYMLEGLDRQSSQDLLAARGITEEFFDELYKLTSGHPLSLELIETPERRIQVANLEVYFEEEIMRRLPDADKKVLQQASVYRYPVPADGLLTESDQDYESIANLIRHALINQNAEGEYYLHDLLKGFVLSRLTLHQRRKMYHNAGEFNLNFKDGRSTIDSIYHFLQAHEHLRAARIVLNKGRELIFKGYVDELHDHQVELDHEGLSPVERAGLLSIHGEVDIEVGDWPGAESNLNRALELYTAVGDRTGMGKVLTSLGGLYLRQGEMDQAVARYEASLELCRELKDPEVENQILNGLGVMHWQLEDIPRAKEYLEKSLNIAEQAGHDQGIARAITNLGIIEFQYGDLNRSIDHYNRALVLSEAMKDRKTLAQIYDNLGEAFRLKGDIEQAQEYFDRGIELAENHGFRLIQAHLYRDMSQILEGDEKEDFANQARQIFKELGVKGES